MVSILIPVYNAAATLPSALASVFRQSCREWELLAVDDGSTDSSPAILAAAAAADARVRLLTRPHEGLVPTLNAGLAAARGAWLARFDADDLMHRDRLAMQRAAAFDGVLGCRVRSFPIADVRDGYRRYEDWLNGLLTHEQIVADLYVESPLAHPSVMLPTELLRNAGGYREVGFPEDYDLWLRLHAAGARFGKLPQVLHYWRDHPGRLSRQGGPYAQPAFRACKIAHLRTGLLAGHDAVSLWGAGHSGRDWSRALARAGIGVRCLVDIDPKKIGGTLRGAPVIAPEELRPEYLPLLVTVGVHGARELIRARLGALGFRDGADYVCVA